MLSFVQKISEAQKSVIFLDTGNLAIDNNEQIDNLKHFYHINTYELLTDIDNPTSWDMVFKPVNGFLNSLSEEDQTKIAKVYLIMHSEILEKLSGFSKHSDDKEECLRFSENLDSLTDTLALILGKLDSEIDLIPKLIEYVKTNIEITELENAGMSPQDSKLLTFYRTDLEVLTSIVVFCKLLAPIFGTMIQMMAKRTDNNYKVYHCFAILRHILSNRYLSIYYKLVNYIRNSIDKIIKSDDISHAFNVMTLQTATVNLVAVLLTRRFITVDIFTPNGNLMTYIISCTRSSISTYTQNMAQKNAVREKRDPEEIRGDEGNSSRLENDSKNSKTTADIPILISVSIDLFINDWLVKNPNKQDIYNRTLAFYTSNKPEVTMLNKYLLSIYFGHEINGAAGLDYLKFIHYVKLLSILQIILHDLDMVNIIHPLTFSESSIVKSELSHADQLIKLTWNSMQEYKQCKLLFPYNAGNMEWDSNYKELVDYLITNNFTYNTAYPIWELLGEEPKNNSMVNHSELIMRDIYNLIRYVVYQEGNNDTGYSGTTI